MYDNKVVGATDAFVMPKPDQGWMQASYSGFKDGFNHSMVITGARAATYLYKRISGTPATKSDYEMHYNGMFDWQEGMSLEEMDSRSEDWVSQQVIRQDTAGHGTATQIASLFGGVLSPDLLAFGMAPKLGMSFLNPSLKVARFAELGADASLSEIASYNTAKFSFSRAAQEAINGSVNGTVQSVVTEPFMYAADTFNGDKHDLSSSVMNLVTGFGMGTVFGIGSEAYRSLAPSSLKKISDMYTRSKLAGEEPNLQSLDPEVLADLQRVADMESEVHADLQRESDMESESVPRRAADRTEIDPIGRPMGDRTPSGMLKIVSNIRAALKKVAVGNAAKSGKALAAQNERLHQRITRHLAVSTDDIVNLFNDGKLTKEEVMKYVEGNGEFPINSPEAAKQLRADIVKARKLDARKRADAFINASEAPSTHEEKLLSATFDNLFGTKIRFVERSDAVNTRYTGMFDPKTPDTIYIMRGALEGKDSMTLIAGHEMGHVIRMRDPKLWIEMTNNMVHPDVYDAFLPAWDSTIRAVTGKDPGTYTKDASHQIMDEVYADMLGNAMQSPKFWNNFYRTNPKGARKLGSYVSRLYEKTMRMSGQRGDNKLADALGEALAAISPENQTLLFKEKKHLAQDWDRRIDFENPEFVISSDKKPIVFTGYTKQRNKFLDLQRTRTREYLADLINSRNTQEATLDEITRVLFVEAGSLNDTSGTPEKGNKAYTVEEKELTQHPSVYLATRFLAAGKSGKNASAAKLLKERMQGASITTTFQNGPFATWKKISEPYIKDGKVYTKYRIHLLRNDEHPYWTESRQYFGQEIDDGVVTYREFHEGILNSMVRYVQEEVDYASMGKREGLTLRSLKEAVLKKLTELERSKDVTDDKLVAAHRAGANFKMMESLRRSLDDDNVKLSEEEFLIAANDYFKHSDLEEHLKLPINRFNAKVLLEDFRQHILGMVDKNRGVSADTLYNTRDHIETGSGTDDSLGHNADEHFPEVDLLPEIKRRKEVLLDGLNQDVPTKKQMEEKLEKAALKAADSMYAALALFNKLNPGQDISNPQIPDGAIMDVGGEAAFLAERQKQLDHRMEMFKKDPNMEAAYIWYDLLPADRQQAFRDEILREVDRALLENRPEFKQFYDPENVEDLLGRRNRVIEVHQSDVDAKVIEDQIGSTDLGIDVDAPLARQMSWDEHLQQSKIEQRKRQNESRAALKRVIKNLETEAKHYGKWNSDRAATTKKDTEDLMKKWNIEDLIMKDVEAPRETATGPDTPERPDATPAEERLRKIVKGFMRSHKTAEGDLNRLVRGERFTGEEITPDREIVINSYNRHLRLGDQPKIAKINTAKDIQDIFINRIRVAILSFEAGLNLDSNLRAKNGINTTHSSLDGLYRTGVSQRVVNLESLRQSQTHSDTIALHQVLSRLGLVDAWNDNLLPKYVMRYLEGADPASPEIKHIGDILRQTIDMQAGRSNALGGMTNLLDGFVMSARHNRAKIANDRAGWMKYLMDNLDWEATQNAFGELPTENSRINYLKNVADMLMRAGDDGEFDVATMGGNLHNTTSRHRMLHFEQGTDAAFNYDMRFGSGNTGGEIYSQIMRRAERTALVERFGPDYKKTWNESMINAGLNEVGKLSDLNRMNNTFHQIIGTWDNPVSVPLARLGKTLRNYANSRVLMLSGVSSITDYANLASSLRFGGVPVGTVHSQMIESMKLMASSPEHRAALEGIGLAHEAILNAYTKITEGNWFDRTSDKLSDFVFKASGQDMVTRGFNGAYYDIMTRHLGEMASARTHTEEFKNFLHQNGLTDDFGRMAAHATKVDGLEGVRLSPDMIPDAKLANKLRAVLLDTMSYAALQPSVSNVADLRFGTRAGTLLGEAIRCLMQYKSYPLAVVTKVSARFNFGHGSVDAPRFGVIPKGAGRMEKLAWAGSMMALAVVALSIKDILAGREPMNPFEADHWNWNNFSRVVIQAGVGPVGTIEQFSNPASALGPTFGAAYQGLELMGSQGEPNSTYRNFNFAYSMLPFSSEPLTKHAVRSSLAYVAGESYGTYYELYKDNMTLRTGQEDLLDFGDKPRRK